jgi:hypothetical protein
MYKNGVIALVAILILSFYVFEKVNAETPSPGSSSDPLITKSYLDQNIQNIVANEVAKQSIKVVTLQEGQTLFAKQGTELIVRTGKTVAVSMDTNGIPDLTSGKDIAPGSLIETNHLLLFPREGRGIKPSGSNKGDIYVVVLGGYYITNPDGTVKSP